MKNKTSPTNKGATRKRKRDLQRQARQSFSPTQSPSKRGRDTKEREDHDGLLVERGVKNAEEPFAINLQGISNEDSSKSGFATRHPTSGVDASDGSKAFAALMSRPSSTLTIPQPKIVTGKKAARPAALGLHIPAMPPAWGPYANDAEEFILNSSSTPSPSKYSGFDSPTKSPRKILFGVGWGSNTGLLRELPFALSPGRRADNSFAQASPSSPTLGSKTPLPISPSLESPSHLAIRHAISRRDGTSWVFSGNQGRPPRSALDTLYERPGSPTRFPATENKLDDASELPAPLAINEFLQDARSLSRWVSIDDELEFQRSPIDAPGDFEEYNSDLDSSDKEN